MRGGGVDWTGRFVLPDGPRRLRKIGRRPLTAHCGDGTVEVFGDFGEGGGVEALAKAVELAEAHDERTPAVGVDAVLSVGDEEGVVDVGADDADLEGDGCGGLVRAMAEGVGGLEDGFELDRAFRDAGCADEVGWGGGETSSGELVRFVAIAHGLFVGWYGV